MYKKSFRAKTVKEKTFTNIKDFSTNKVLHTLTKPHSFQTTVFIEDEEDNWLINVISFKTKSGLITNSSMIIRKDVDDWLRHLINLGYEEIKK